MRNTELFDNDVSPRKVRRSSTKVVSSVGVAVGVGAYMREGTGWDEVGCGEGSGGSTTISASSSPAHDDEPEPPRVEPDVSPRKKPRK
ncbi:hypothetical protein K1T71_001577 [Dendrolimus kikuchii]|uniref:Uncharacterized protein n=1 Tax=Dendrolimus kikuchii TaxID=765133 RepID=A0ACC1DE39_9NEOP|nr:hypothetical protein K1T71_001577 [Dendrolimus kikuchii]